MIIFINENDNGHYEKFQIYGPSRTIFKMLAAEMAKKKSHKNRNFHIIHIIFATKIFLCYIVYDFETTSTAINIPQQTVVKSYICFYNKIGC